MLQGRQGVNKITLALMLLGVFAIDVYNKKPRLVTAAENKFLTYVQPLQVLASRGGAVALDCALVST